MKVKKKHLAIVTTITLALSLGVFNKEVKTQTYGCYIYENENFGGESAYINAGVGHPVLEDWWSQNWNDRVTSIQIVGPYKLIVYEHSDYQGESKVFYEGTRNIGSLWNDQISSLKCFSISEPD
jgi:hypothetical protein